MTISIFTPAPSAALPLVRGRPWSLPATWRNPAAPGQPPGSGSIIDLTGASASCTVVWARGSIVCAMAPLNASGSPTPSLTAAQTAAIPTGPAMANLALIDPQGNAYDFQIGLQVTNP